MLGLAGVAPRAAALESIQVAPGLRIHPRDQWGADLAPTGTIWPEEVKFLLVHHTATSNRVPSARDLIRSVYRYHTGPAKRWPDVCYQFFVAPDGSVWEGRAGSLAGGVVADATGGNQGFAQLVCLIGNYSEVAPTHAAQQSLMRTLLFLADRYGLDTDPAATATFTSRGSNKFPAGSTVSTSTLSGHRDCTYTTCPGDAAYALLDDWRARVHATRRHREQPAGLHQAMRRSIHLDP